MLNSGGHPAHRTIDRPEPNYPGVVISLLREKD